MTQISQKVTNTPEGIITYKVIPSDQLCEGWRQVVGGGRALVIRDVRPNRKDDPTSYQVLLQEVVRLAGENECAAVAFRSARKEIIPC